MTHLREPDAAAQQRGSTTVSQPALFVPALDDAALFALLDEIAEGLAHEARLDEQERAAKAPVIARWFAPRLERLETLWRARPCPAPWRLSVAADLTLTIEEAPDPCEHCFNVTYRAWLVARGRTSIVPGAQPEADAA